MLTVIFFCSMTFIASLLLCVGQLFGTGLILATLIVVCSAITLRMHYKGSQVSTSLPNLFLVKHLARLTCMQSYVEELISSEPVSILFPKLKTVNLLTSDMLHYGFLDMHRTVLAERNTPCHATHVRYACAQHSRVNHSPNERTIWHLLRRTK
jgi:hypothetical protein